MVTEKEFGTIRSKVMELKTGTLHNISPEQASRPPVIARAIDVEQDGHIWMTVNSRMKKWNRHCNVPVRIQFTPEDCNISLSGIGEVTATDQLPLHLQDKARNAKAVMRMKIFYGEYVPLAGTNQQGFWSNVKNWFTLPASGDLLRSSRRRLLIFRRLA